MIEPLRNFPNTNKLRSSLINSINKVVGIEGDSIKQSLILLSLQGLGNSILNLPLYLALREKYDVKVQAFENGSAQFYRSFGLNVESVKSVPRLALQCLTSTDVLFVPYPAWRREWLAKTLIWSPDVVHVQRKAEHKHDLIRNWSKLQDLLGVENPRVWGEQLVASLTGKLPPQRNKRVLGIHAGASTSVKFYPLTFWKDFFDNLSGYDEVNFFCGGNTVEQDHLQKIIQQISDDRGLKIRTHISRPFPEVLEILGTCGAFIGYDSSLMHLAAISGCPVLGLWSFADWRRICPFGRQTAVYISHEAHEKPSSCYLKTTPQWVGRAQGKYVAQELLPGLSSVDHEFGEVSKFIY